MNGLRILSIILVIVLVDCLSLSRLKADTIYLNGSILTMASW
jgi:hypothetical protein